MCINYDLIARKVLMSSYLYYIENTHVISDAENDTLCVQLADNWGEVPDRYKTLLDPDNTNGEALRTSTYQCKHTELVKAGALSWLRDVNKKEKR